MVKIGRKPLVHFLLVPVMFLSIFFLGVSPRAQAQNNAAFVREVRAMEAEETGLQSPAGLAFSPKANVFLVLEAYGQGSLEANETGIFRVTEAAKPAGSGRIAAAVQDPINTAYDARVGRLLIYKASARQLIEVREGPDGALQAGTLVRHDVRHFGLQDPQGMTVDPASGELYFLDAGPRIVKVVPEADGSFEQAAVSAVDASGSGVAGARGLAFEPATGHLHLLSPAAKKLYELSQAGQVVGVRDLAEVQYSQPQGMVFAPSGDQTDDPQQMSLYLADSGPATGEAGQIVELSLVEPFAVAVPDFTSTLVVTRNLAAMSPPSPDPAGITYIPARGTFLISDSEVDETVNTITHWQGANVWEITKAGSKVSSANISRISPSNVPLSNEPTGIAYVPATGHVLVCDDGLDQVFNIAPGPDGDLGTTDDTWTSFDTLVTGNADPEDLVYDPAHNQILVVDELDLEVYKYTMAGALAGHFDIQQHGLLGPDGIAYRPGTQTFFIIDSNRSNEVIIEVTAGGTLVQTIDFSAANALKAAGIAFAPASNGTGASRFYIVDRGIDNNINPNIIDGKMYEMTAPTSGVQPGSNRVYLPLIRK